MYKLYYIVSPSTNGYYIGITKQSLEDRFYGHKYSSKSGSTLPLYNAMRKYNDFCIVLISEFSAKETCCEAEKIHISTSRDNKHNLYNISSGGDIGFQVDRIDKEAWITKLKGKRTGRKPFLGCTHSEENKKFFVECNKKRWDLHGRYPVSVITLSFKDAHGQYGISKTHYYRLKRAGNNELS